MRHMSVILVSLFLASCANEEPTTTPTQRGMLSPQDAAVAVCPEISVDGFACTNHQGSEITFDGEVSWSGLQVQFIFRNNDRGTHERKEVQYTAVLVDAGTLVFDKEPVLGGVGGNPKVWVQFLDGDGNPLTGEIYQGRCVQDGR